MLVAAILCLLVVGSYGSKRESHGQPGVFECEGREPGYYTDYERYCKVFYHCDGVNKVPYGCGGPGDFCFDDVAKQCLPCKDVSCPRPDVPSASKRESHGQPGVFECEGREPGYYTDYERNCKVFYQCTEEGHKLPYGCKGEDECFDDEAKQCRPCNDVSCPTPNVPSKRESHGQPGVFECEGREPGYYTDYERNCKVFYQCTEEGHKLPFGCKREDECFDDEVKQCRPCNDVSCPTPNVPSKRESHGQPGVFECEGREPGYYTDYERNCKVFYQCTDDEHKLPFVCKGEDECFDDVAKLCLPCKDVSCPTPDVPARRSISARSLGQSENNDPSYFECSGRKPGYYADFYRACHVFYLCEQNDSRTSLLCGPTTCFDDEEKVCRLCRDVKCPFPAVPAKRQVIIENIKK